MPDRSPSVLATAIVRLRDPQAMARMLCQHFAEYGTVHLDGRESRIETDFGTARLKVCTDELSLEAEGRDETGLAFVKLSLAEHLRRLARDDEPVIVWRGDGLAGRPLPYFREMTVVSNESLTPRMRRIRLRGENLARFATGGLHVRLLFPRGRTPAWPVTGDDGRPEWPRGADRPDARVYTIRHIDIARGEIDIDFVLHSGDCPGGEFARGARLGDLVGMTGPGGGATPRADWMLLAGDETALPAISRILQELPATTMAVVRIEVGDASDEIALPSGASVDLQWLHRDAGPAGQGLLLEEAAGRVELPEHGSRFVWVGCEHATFRSIRRRLRKNLQLTRDEHLVVAYWRRGHAGEGARKDDEQS